MNKNRLNAYHQLIATLLSCPSGKEGAILSAKSELLDVGLVKEMLTVSSYLINQGKLNDSNRLMYAIGHLLGVYPNASVTSQENFLVQLLRVTEESRGNPQIVYPLLEANQALLDKNFPSVLDNWARATLPQKKPKRTKVIAGAIFEFSTLVQQFPLGNRAINLEIAITGYKVILKIFTRDASPIDWAATQNNLGAAYSDRIVGDRAENLEIAIKAYKAALLVRTREALPSQWAETQNNLGNAYIKRIFGDRRENLEDAIAAYTTALEVYTRYALPTQWAETQNNLGIAYRNRIVGDKGENLEAAIKAYKAALSVHTRNASPNKWAMTQANLGTAYSERIVGDKGENFEAAINAYKAALSVHTLKALPIDWAATQNNLGGAYSNRIKGDRAENLEAAINAYKAALSIRTREALPVDWAETQNNLGVAYSSRIKGDRAENLEAAINAYKAALSVRTHEALPIVWATTQNNLGAAYWDRGENLEAAINAYTDALKVFTRNTSPIEWAATQNNLGAAYTGRTVGNRGENLESAIKAYKAALSVRTREALPIDWAQTQHNLGNAYSERIVGSRRENLEAAINTFCAALSVRTREAFPQNHADTLYKLGLAYQKSERLDLAYTNFEQAIDTVEFLRGEIVSGDETKRKQAEYSNQVYRHMVEVCLQLKLDTQAIEYIERSKTRNLVEFLALKDLYPGGEITPEVRQQLRQLRQDIGIEKRRLAVNKNPDYTHLNQLRQRYNELYPYEPIKYSEIQQLLDDNTAIIEWYFFFGNCFSAFIITRNSNKPIIWHSDNQDLDKLRNWTNDYITNYQDKEKWINQLSEKLRELGEILHIDEIISRLPDNCQKLIFIPHRYLHLLPLHALQLKNGEYIIDKFRNGVGYAPSCQLLQIAQQKSQDAQLHISKGNLFAIQNPTEDLTFTDIEVETIASTFRTNYILKKDQATKIALTQPPHKNHLYNANWLHFSCHGYFYLKSPLESGLALVNSIFDNTPTDAEASQFLKFGEDVYIDLQQCLTLQDIFEWNLPNCQLVTLSACETGLTDFRNTSDEYIGLPNGFIRAGSPNVVSSLWAVNELSTALLMIQLYENLQQDFSVYLALNEAQKWLRNATKEDLLKLIIKLPNVHHRIEIRRLLNKQPANSKPFASPYYWAAFCAIGK